MGDKCHGQGMSSMLSIDSWRSTTALLGNRKILPSMNPSMKNGTAKVCFLLLAARDRARDLLILLQY